MRHPRVHPCARGAATAAAAWALWCLVGAGQAPPADAGRRFYREGIAAGGGAIAAVVQQDIRVRSTGMPCVNCHRRSGWGTAEGPVTTPPVVGRVLFAPVTRGIVQMGTVRTTGAGTRPAYTDESLVRAVRDGVDSAGRALSPTMPRYALDGETASSLAEYLRGLGAEPPAGVTPESVHLATITTPGVSAARRASMHDVLETYVRHKNAGTRNETGRRARGPWDMAQHAGKYRTWILHEWTLHGSPGTWAAQLAERYEREPVFAFVSGLGDGDWTPIQEFAERVRVPVILPQLARPPAPGSGDDFYSLYFSQGLDLEEALLAHQLVDSPAGTRVLHVSRCGTAGEAAAAAARRRAPWIESRCVEAGAALTAADWEGMLARRPDTLALWLGPDDLESVPPLPPGAVTRIYLSSTLLGDRLRTVPERIAARACVLHPFVLPDELERHVYRALVWLKGNDLAPADRGVAVNTLFAASVVADALSHPRTLESRDYFIERLEHLVSLTPHRSTYPEVILGPRRRFASAGGYVLQFPAAAGGPFRKVGSWFVPAP